MLIKKIIGIFVCILFFGAAFIPSSVGIIYKKANSINPVYRGYIQDLIDNASDGDTIYIPSGTYYENIIIDKSINLLGEYKENTIIDGRGSGYVIHVTADWVNISGFNVRNGNYGLYFKNSSNNTVIQNKIDSNSEFGIFSNCSTNILVSECIVFNNGYGITFWNSSYNQISYCNTNNNTIGIALVNSSNNLLNNNIANNNTYKYSGPPPNMGPLSAGIVFAQSTQNKLINNCLSDNILGFCYFNLYNQSKRKSYFNNTIDTSNKVNGKSVLYYFNQKNIILDSIETSHLTLAFCDNCVIKNCNISNGDGIFLWSSSSNIIANCISSNNYQGIILHSSELSYSNNNIINNCEVYNNFFYGIGIQGGSSNNTLSNCNIYNNRLSSYGIGLNIDGSPFNNILNNTFNNDGLLLGGDIDQDFIQNIDGNTVNGKALYYFLNQQNIEIDGEPVGQFLIINCSNFLIKNIEISNTAIGIEIQFSNNISIVNCEIYNISWAAIGTGYFSSDLYIYNVTLYRCGFGIGFGNTSYSSILKCNLYDNLWFGISLVYSSTNNFISKCNICNNSEIGLLLIESSLNAIYLNNFKNNKNNAFDDGNNIWNGDKYGNYWDDYRLKYPNARKIWWKGIWDTPYEIPGGGNKDRYPLINEWVGSLSNDKSNGKIINRPLLMFLQSHPYLLPLLQRLKQQLRLY